MKDFIILVNHLLKTFILNLTRSIIAIADLLLTGKSIYPKKFI